MSTCSALREQVTGAMSVQTVLDRTRRTVLEALDHQEYPFSLLATELRSTRDPRQASPVNVLFALQRFHMLHQLDTEMTNRESGRPVSMNTNAWDLFCDSAAGRAVQSLPRDDGVGRRGQWMFRISCRAVHFRIDRSHDTALPTDLGWDGGPYRPACFELSLMTDAERERVLTRIQWSCGASDGKTEYPATLRRPSPKDA